MAGITPRQKISATGSIVYEEKIGMHVEKTRIRRVPFHAVFSGEFFIYYFGVSYSSIVHFSIGCCYLPFFTSFIEQRAQAGGVGGWVTVWEVR